MSLNITQYPATASLAQSPMIFTVYENTQAVLSSSFQYYANLYYWNGQPNNSGSVPDYQLVKFPNESFVGMFDVSRILNSTLQDLAFANTSNVKYYKCEFYWSYLENNIFVSSSKVDSGVYKALDGYGIFQEPINQQIYSKTPHWPIMTDGPVSQSFLDDTIGYMTVYTGNAGTTQPNRLVYSGSLNNAAISFNNFPQSEEQTLYFPITADCSDFPLNALTDTFSIQAYSGSVALGTAINFSKVCKQKYPNVRIKWKNRYGQFDYYNFLLVNRQGFQSTKRTYQPQLGSWQGTSLSYQDYDSSTLNYISDSKQTISVNSDYLRDEYNDIFKQLLVSDEIYWVYGIDEEGDGFSLGYDNGFTSGVGLTELVRPITITTNNIVFKTGVNDKLVQYQFDFDWGQSYKLII
jgi:hypothetical protein